ncbi:MAG TPA: MMPL family transporter [Polyangiaceae bacterium LLY-WYZ-15_(1-7)]|nr:hypothetical protein [Myxococcales bacterium]MAT26604.1 hypothetical protein [Sandaracinus sp.]HJL05135.1 MMPL family transporter [Polyangiaceae bacterium LLY-WYZ-15_(1-7)]HJL12986.1 MMPL family transporter [Polyangiaceae bacterium LLY-WYZ-15_(1-7)]HJL27083.1 MMPL family transporter [Polyangiaceae bacterium LLY-WYZ-15_(1-7)]
MAEASPHSGHAPLRFFRALLARRRLAFALHALVLGLAGAFASQVRPNYDAKGFLPSFDARRQSFEAHAAAFPESDRQVSVFLGASTDANTDANTARDGRTAHDGRSERAAAHATLAEVAALLRDEGLLDVRWAGNVDVAEADPDDPFAVRVHPLGEDGLGALDAWREDPLLAGRLFDRGLETFAVHATLPPERDTPEGQLALTHALEARLAPLRAAGHDLRLAGLPVLKARGFELVQGDSARFLGLGVLFVALLLGLALRRLRDVFVVLAGLLPAYVTTLGVMGATGTPISALTSFIPLLVLVVGVCDALHLIVHVREKRAAGLPRREAIARAFAELFESALFTSLTTALGFLSLVVSGVAIVVELALFTSLAVALGFVFTVTLLPLLLDLGRERPAPEDGPLEAALDRIVDGARRFARRPHPLALAGAFLLAAACVAGATGLRANGTMIDDVDPAHPLMRDLGWLEARGFGVHGLPIWIRGASEDELKDPAMLAWMDETAGWLRRQEPVRSAIAPTDFIRQAKRALTGDASLPATREEAAQLLLLVEMADDGFMDEVLRRTPDTTHAQLVAQVSDLGSARMAPFFDALEARLAAHPPPHGEAIATGTLRLAHVALADIVGGFGGSLALAALLIVLLMAWRFRSLAQGLVALVPNALPLVALLGVMRLGGFDVKPSTLLVFSVAFGVAVDDTIHLLGRVSALLREGRSVDEAIDAGLRTTGRALLLTSVVLGGGFAVLLASDFQFLFLVGLMTAVAVVVALLADLLVYPALLRWSLRRSPTPSPAPA